MDDEVYKILIIIGIIGVIVILIVIFINELGQFFKGVVEWVARNVLKKGQFDPITVWDWAITIGAIVFSIIYCIVKGVED